MDARFSDLRMKIALVLGPSARRISVFGSFARGDATEQSDIDLITGKELALALRQALNVKGLCFMKKFDDKARLGHIFDAISAIEKYVTGVEKDDFLENNMMQDAVMRQIEIIGEAAGRISDGLQDKYPDLPALKDQIKNLLGE